MKEPNLLYTEEKKLADFLKGKSETSLKLFDAFIKRYKTIGEIGIHPAKTMIGISNSQKRVVWVNQFGKSFLNVVFPFTKPYPDNLCFQKIANVPGDEQYNHHLRLLHPDDINKEVMKFMKLAYEGENKR